MKNRMMKRMMVAAVAAVVMATGVARAQDDEHRGRKYKAPPATAHVEVTVVRDGDMKPLQNVGVVFHPVKDGRDSGNLEMKSDPEGKAVIDIIPVGSHMRLQVIAKGYATFGDDYEVGDRLEILVKMKRPVQQVSTYRENGAAAVDTPGVQEPARPKVKAKPPTPGVLPITLPPKATAPEQTTAAPKQ